MTQTTPRRSSDDARPSPIGPQRFQTGSGGQPADRSLPRLLGAVAAVLVLVVGVPVLLLALHGLPSVPTSWPSRSDLSDALSAEQLVSFLVAVAFLAWLQFTVCLVVELVSALRGRSLPVVVPLSGPSQRLARALVASIVIAAVTAGPAAAATDGGGAPVRTGPVASQAAAPSSVATTLPDRVPGASLAEAVSAPSDSSAALDHLPAEVRDLVGRKVYVVKAPEGRYHESLWDIAERHLGDGRRYKEIFALNHGREQRDGRRLDLARLIQPGWQLVLPDDATGVARFDAGAHLAAGTTPAVSVGERTAARAAELANRSSDLAGSADQAGAGAGADTGASSGAAAASSATVERGALAVGGLLAAGLLSTLVALRRRRGAEIVLEPEPEDAEVALRVQADLARSGVVDRALRALAASSRSHGLALPAVYAALVTDLSLDLLLAPASPQAPPGWSVEDNGRRWRLDLSGLDGLAEDADVPPPYPALVAVGRDADGRDVLVDLDAAAGPIALSGDPLMCGQLAVAIGVGLATSPWSASVRVGVTGLAEDVLALAPDRLHRVDDPAAAIRAAVDEAPSSGDVLTGARGMADRVDLLVLASDPGAEALAPLQTRAGREVGGLLIAADLPDAAWRLHVDEAGTVDIAPLDVRVTGNRLDAPTVRALRSLLDQARAESARVVQPGGSDRAVERVEAPEPAQACDDAAYAAAAVRVSVLGVPDVRAGGAMDASRIPLATEVATYLALHRDGIHPTVLGGAIWPRGVGSDVLEATIERVRDWLGTDALGHHVLRTLPDGRLSLAPDVPSDWDVVCTLVRSAQEARDEREEADRLRRALRVVRGPLLAGAPQGRYSWIVRTRLERTVPRVVTEAAHRLAGLMLAGSDGEAAATAARSGLRLDPGAQVLWRDLLRAAHQVEGSDGVRSVVAEARSMLRDLGEPVEAETEALVDELSPGTLADWA